MKFLVDESAGASVARVLRELGHDVVEAAVLSPSAPDAALLQTALTEQRIVVTNDKDFGELVFRGGQGHPGIILFRLEDETAANRQLMTRQIVERYPDELANSFTVVTERGVRIRKMK